MLKSKSVKKGINFCSMLFALALVSTHSFALHGGFQTVTNTTKSFQTWLYAIIGVVSIIILLVSVGLVYAKRATWGDFMQTLGWVAVGGGSLTLATFVYGIFA